MGGRRIAPVTIAALAAVVISGGASAQPKDPGGGIEMEAGSAAAGAPTEATPPAAPVKDPKIARKWLAAAQQLMQKAGYLAAKNRPDEAKAQLENAVTAYQKAIEAGDDVNLYFDLANAEDKLGKIDDAVKYLRIVATRPGVRPDVVKKAAAKLEDLSAKVGLVTLSVTPAGSSITLGGTELGTSPLPGSLVLMPGTYTLSFQADGFQPKEAEIKIEPGSETERSIALEPVKVIVAPVEPAVSDDAIQGDNPKPPSKLPLYLGAGVTGAGVLGAGIFGILAISQHSTFTGASTSRLDRADARTNGQRFALITDLSLGTAAVAAGFTAYWYYYKYKQRPEKPEERHPPPVDPTGENPGPTGKAVGGPTARASASLIETKLEVVPWVQSQSGGVTIAGWF